MLSPSLREGGEPRKGVASLLEDRYASTASGQEHLPFEQTFGAWQGGSAPQPCEQVQSASRG